MRPIKFRAWDIDHKQFIYFDLGNPDDNLFGRHGVLGGTVIKDWQQFTGLLDKNGKEIYEADQFIYNFDKWEIFWQETFGRWAAMPVDGRLDTLPLTIETA